MQAPGAVSPSDGLGPKGSGPPLLTSYHMRYVVPRQWTGTAAAMWSLSQAGGLNSCLAHISSFLQVFLLSNHEASKTFLRVWPLGLRVGNCGRHFPHRGSHQPTNTKKYMCCDALNAK